MMLERIGIIGKTQGVSESSSPKPKKVAIITRALPPARAAAIWSCSLTGVSAAAGAAWVAGAATGAAGAAGLSALRAGSASSITFFIGG